ncbi:MAG: hypothetical protein OXG15_13070 [Gammaproteobacteria bacterium]|nr:hypothetical protein [Gammaproteobacteria bacterium]
MSDSVFDVLDAIDSRGEENLPAPADRIKWKLSKYDHLDFIDALEECIKLGYVDTRRLPLTLEEQTPNYMVRGLTSRGRTALHSMRQHKQNR